MTAIGGSLESVTLDGREFPVTADADINRKLGGFENEIQPNGDGSARMIKTRVTPMLGGVVVECDDARGDLEFLQGLADGNIYFPVAATYADGGVYQGSMQITGELQHSNSAATASFDLAGQGVLTRQ